LEGISGIDKHTDNQHTEQYPKWRKREEQVSQFHLVASAGRPDIADRQRLQLRNVGTGPGEVDVLSLAADRPAALAAQRSVPDIKTCIVEQKEGRLLLGQADGIACRTMEMFHAYGFSERVLKEACWINETTFWKPDPAKPDTIVRSGRVQDVEDGLSEFPHVVLNQARVHVAISMSCANRRQSSSRIIHGACSMCRLHPRRALKTMR
jgi:hypothetical protein